MKKYRLTDEMTKLYGRSLYRIEALRDFADVKKGDKGGWIEKEQNLSHFGDSWVYEGSTVYGNANVSENAKVFGSVKVFGNARVHGDCMVCGVAQVFGRAKVFGNATVLGDAFLCLESSIFWVSNIGSRLDTITVFKCSDGLVKVTCGYFYGTIKEFAERVERVHGNNKYGREYKAVIELIKIHFDLNGE